jgi:AcrR family transcriptional regulator
MTSVGSLDRISRRQADKFAERRAELAQAALHTLAQLGYARTSLREIAQNSAFSHGVLHYYFSDKLDLITCCVRDYKARCVARYDDVILKSTTYEAVVDSFLDALSASLRDDAPMHRLWYDMRAQALFEPAFRADVGDIDHSLEDMVWRIMSRAAELRRATLTLPSSVMYATIDGLFQQALLRLTDGDERAIDDLRSRVKAVLGVAVDQTGTAAA